MALKGNSAKDSAYLARIKRATEHHPHHPRHHGVAMQAHHLISAEGMKRSMLGRKIEKFGYDINNLENLVFIPCTLQGACHLDVQPHRGNHTAPAFDPDNYDDDDHPISYHDMVAKRIKRLNMPLDRECTGHEDARVKEIKNKLDDLSHKILLLIQHQPGAAPLTAIAAHFNRGDTVGCANVDAVRAHRSANPCVSQRDHGRGRRAKSQTAEAITCGRGTHSFVVGK